MLSHEVHIWFLRIEIWALSDYKNVSEQQMTIVSIFLKFWYKDKIDKQSE